jgi:tRNA pseudouridine38-40 synthase
MNLYEMYAQDRETDFTASSFFSNAPISTMYEPVYAPEALRKGLNFHLQTHLSQISITDCSSIHPHFDARHDAIGRTYMYRILAPNPRFRAKTFPSIPSQAIFHNERAWILPFPMNVQNMQVAARHFLGEQDFSSVHGRKKPFEISRRHVNNIAVSSHSSIDSDHLSSIPPWERSARPASGLDENFPDEDIRIHIRADSFVQRMVRNIVGMLVAVGAGRLSPEDIPRLLAHRDRSKIFIQPAPASGLYLQNVHYMDDH